MQHIISFNDIKKHNQTLRNIESDVLPGGQSYSDFDDDIPEPEYDPRDDDSSPYFRLPDFDINQGDRLLKSPQEATCKTLRGVQTDSDGWTTTDIPEGSQKLSGDVIERQVIEDSLPGFLGDHLDSEVSDDLADYDDVKL